MAAKAATRVQLCCVDVDNSALQSVVKKHSVNCMPTLVYFKGGKQVDQSKGVDRALLDIWLSGGKREPL